LDAKTLEIAIKAQSKINQKEKMLEIVAQSTSLRIIAIQGMNKTTEVELGDVLMGKIKEDIIKALTNQLSGLQTDFKAL
jgi:hypothetical protein